MALTLAAGPAASAGDRPGRRGIQGEAGGGHRRVEVLGVDLAGRGRGDSRLGRLGAGADQEAGGGAAQHEEEGQGEGQMGSRETHGKHLSWRRKRDRTCLP